MDALEKKKGITDPEQWYSIDTKDLKREAGLRSLLARYSGSLFSALKVIDPTLFVDDSRPFIPNTIGSHTASR